MLLFPTYGITGKKPNPDNIFYKTLKKYKAYDIFKKTFGNNNKETLGSFFCDKFADINFDFVKRIFWPIVVKNAKYKHFFSIK